MFRIGLTSRAALKARHDGRGLYSLSPVFMILVANMSGVRLRNKLHGIVTAYALASALIYPKKRRIKSS